MKVLFYLLGLSCLLKTTYCHTRAVWISNYDQQLKSVAGVHSIVDIWKSFGIKTVYVDVWNSGKLYAKSPTYESLFMKQIDFLGNALEGTKDSGIEIFAWFEYGNMATYKGVVGEFANHAKNKGWLIKNGSVKSHGFTWCDPGHPEFAKFLVKMTKEVDIAYSKYSHYKGIQYDDHLAYPADLPVTRYSPNRATAVYNLAKNLSSAVGANKFSLSPMTMPFSKTKSNVDWPRWLKEGIIFEVVPQTYFSNLSSFSKTLNTQLRYAPKSKLRAGIRCNGTGSNTSFSVVKQMLEYSKKTGIKGIVIWYTKCLYDTYKSQFEAYWGKIKITQRASPPRITPIRNRTSRYGYKSSWGNNKPSGADKNRINNLLLEMKNKRRNIRNARSSRSRNSRLTTSLRTRSSSTSRASASSNRKRWTGFGKNRSTRSRFNSKW